MATVNPQTFFRFAADHHALLIDLYYKRDGLSEAELMELIRRHADEATPGPLYMRDRLLGLGLLESAPHAAAQFEMVRPVARLMGFLLREHRLTSVAVIQSYFKAIDGLATDMSAAVGEGNSDMVVRVSREIDEHMERMRHDSRENRDSVTSTVVSIKTNRERTPPRRRYEIVNRLWTRYIVPLRDIIDTEKSMDAALDRVDRIHAAARAQFAADATMQQLLRIAGARLRRMRHDVLEDFLESIREVTPLYEELRQETAIARGAAQALKSTTRDGLARLALSRRLGISNWQRQGLFGDSALEAYLHVLHGYEPTVPAPLASGPPTAAEDYLTPQAFEAQVHDALPIRDALDWLSSTYADASLTTVLRLYGRLHSGRLGRLEYGSEARQYWHDRHTLTAHPMAVHDHRPGKGAT